MKKKPNKKDDLSNKTKKELMEMAKKLHISFKPSYLKDKLIELIQKAVPKSSRRSSKESKKEPVKVSRFVGQAVRQSGSQAVSQLASQTFSQPVTSHEIRSTNYEVRTTSFEFPRGYGKDAIVIMVRDPYWLFAYWEVTAGKIDEIKARLRERFNGAKLILRVYDVTDINFNEKNAWKTFDIEVTGGADNWYINLSEANRSYIVDVGFLTADGEFILCARSNCVTTPRDGASDVIDEEWMTEEYEKVYALSGGFGVGKSSGELREMIKKRRLELMFGGASEGSGRKT